MNNMFDIKKKNTKNIKFKNSFQKKHLNSNFCIFKMILNKLFFYFLFVRNNKRGIGGCGRRHSKDCPPNG